MSDIRPCSPIATRYGDARVYVFVDPESEKEHVALVFGNIKIREKVPVRLHSECLTGEILGSLKCDCKDQLDFSLEYFATGGVGILLYLRQEGRGIGLANKIRAYALQAQGYDTVSANLHLGFEDDLRSYSFAAQILHELKVISVQLLTNNPKKVRELESNGIVVVDRIPVITKPNVHNIEYMRTKRKQSGHLFEELALEQMIANCL